MLAFIAQMFNFMQGRPDHPIYRRELAGWSYVRLWRVLRRGCLPLILVIALGSAACCGLMTLATFSQEQLVPDWVNRILLTLGASVLGIFWASEVMLQMAGLVATALTSTTISAEMEADTFGLVRLTLVPMREIVLAKFGAAVRQLRVPIVASLLARTLLLVAIPLLLIVASVYGLSTAAGAPGGAASPPSTGGFPGALLPASLLALIPLLMTSALGLVTVIVAGLLWLAYYFAQPALDIMLFSAVGVAGSTLARTRASGLFAGFGMRAALWAVTVMCSQLASSAISIALTPAMMLPAMSSTIADALANNPGLAVAFYAASIAGSVLIAMIFEFGATVALLRFAEARASRLPFNG